MTTQAAARRRTTSTKSDSENGKKIRQPPLPFALGRAHGSPRTEDRHALRPTLADNVHFDGNPSRVSIEEPETGLNADVSYSDVLEC